MKTLLRRNKILFGLFWALAFNLSYSQGLTLNLDPPSVMLREYSYNVPIRVSNFDSVGAFQFDIPFNTSNLQLAAEPSASFLGSAIFSNTVDNANTNGYVRIGWTSGSASLNFGTGDLLSVKFNVRPDAKIGSDSLEFANGTVLDVHSKSLNPQFYGSPINVNVPPRPVLKIGSLSQSTGASVLVPLYVTNFNNVAKYDFTLAYDSRYLNYQNTQNIPPALDSAGTITHKIVNDTLNSISYKWTFNGLAPYFFGNDSLKNLFNISFACSGGAHSTEIRFTECTVLLPSGNSLEPVQINGAINIVTEVKENSTPDYFYLHQNYPNPFNPSTTISYRLPAESFVTLKVYNILGNEVALLVNEKKNAGTYNVTLSSHNLSLSSGVYFYKLDAGVFHQVRKMIVLK